LEVIGRAERGRDLTAAEAAFTQAYDIATAAGSAVWRVRALHELGTIDMYETMATERLADARREALELGLMSTVAVVDLQLAAIHDERGELDLALDAARRCEDLSRKWKLSTLPMSLAAQAVVHSRAGRRAAMDESIAAALATGEDREFVEITVWGSAVGIFHIVDGDLPAAAAALDRAMETLRQRPAAVRPFPGLWALVRTVIDDGGDAARAEVAGLRFDMPVSRAMLDLAEAVALGRAGDGRAAVDCFTPADETLGSWIGGFRRSLARLVVAPAAHRDGWGDPFGWLREALAVFDTLGLDWFAARCRTELRELGAVVPRRGRRGSHSVPPSLARLGVTSREVDVLALVAVGLTNREAGQRLFISTRTVDKHVERLMQKTGATRAGLADVARAAHLLGT
jgi:DNA-binding CsgD family transcriptional regulator